MDNFDEFPNWGKMFENLNKISNSINKMDWISKVSSIHPLKITSIEMFKEFQKNSFYNFSFHKNVGIDLNWINESSIKLANNHKIGINLNTEILEKISSNYWGNIAKIAILDEFQSALNDDGLEDVVLNISNNIDIINANLHDIDENSLAFFNKICVSVKSYIDENPSIKYSALFVFWLIGTILIPILLTKNDDSKPAKIQVCNEFKTTNNFYPKSVLARINKKSVMMKNFPRDKSKTVNYLEKDEEVSILKDSLKWALVIKTNSIQAGWIRKEYLNFIK